jgi:hypothetical protein
MTPGASPAGLMGVPSSVSGPWEAAELLNEGMNEQCREFSVSETRF